MKPEIFKTSGLTYKYNHQSPFNLNTEAFVIRESDSISIVGPSGGGKSTLLRLIEGSLVPDGVHELIRNGKAVLIYQDLRLVNEKTALENCLMGAISRKHLSGQEKEKEALELLNNLGILNFKDQPVSMLSGGQKQRVAIARSLMSRPQLLLADEPFSHLDFQTALETYQTIKDLQKKMKFAWVVTVHQNELSNFQFDQIWTVQNGSLFFHKEKLHQPKVSAEVFKKKPLPSISLFLFLVFLITFWFLSQIRTTGFDVSDGGVELANFFEKLVFHSFSDLLQVKWSFLFERLIQTIQMAFIATVLGFLISVPLGFLSAEGVATKIINRPLRLLLMIIRSVPALIWALFFVAGLGLGVLSGIAALTVYSIGYFSKLLYEGIEDLERKPFMALRQLGASRIQAMWYALLPSSKPLLVSSFVFLLEYNVRAASLLGLVGAGGIGQDLIYSIEWRDYPTVFSILILLISVVFVFDFISAWTREHIKKLRGI